MSLDALSDKLVEQLYGKQSKGILPVESYSGDNCGDALANFLNSGPLKDTGLTLPRGGVGPGDLVGVGKARGASVLGRGDLDLDSLTPGTVIHMTRQPGDRNYEYGSTHIGIVDEDEQGNKMFKSFTAGKGWRNEAIDQRFIDRLPAQITATNPVNPSGGWLAKVGNLLGPSASQAGELPKGQGQEDDLATRLTNQLYGEEPGQEDLATKLTNQLYGEDAKVALAPTIPMPTKSVMPDSDYNSMLYGQDPTFQSIEMQTKVSATIDPEGEEKAYKKFLKGPRKELKPKDLSTQYHESMLGLVSSIPGVPSLGPPPPGGYDELGNRLDAEGRSFTPSRPDTEWTRAVDRLEGLGKDIIRLGKDPGSAIVGAGELAWDIGTFGLGLVGATAAGIERLPNVISKLGTGENTLLDAYNVMKDQFQSMAEMTDPGKQWMKKALGLPTDAADSLVKALGGTPMERGPSEAIGEAVMLPLTMTNSWFQGVADEIHNSEYPMPNTEGLLRFMGEGTGFYMMAKFHRGGIRGLKKGMDVLGKEINEFRGLTSRGFPRGPDMDAAWARLAEIKAGEVEATATEIAKDFDPNRPIIDEVQVAGEEAVKKAEGVEEAPVETITPEPKPKPLTAAERVRAKKAKEGVRVEDEVVPEPEPKPTPKPKVVPTPPERTLPETDPQTSSFRQDPEVTRVRAQAFDERGVQRDLLSIHAKALNDVNRWLDGDEGVSIEPVRRLLSDLAAKVEDPAHDRIMLDMLGTPREVELFKKISKESATWARRVEREKGTKAPKVEEVVPEIVTEESAPKVNNLPSIEQKLETPRVAEAKVKELADNEAWKQAEVDAKVAEDTMFTQGAIERYYGKGLDELSDAEVISYMNKELFGKGGETELYSGIPVHLLGKAIKNIFRKGKEELPDHEDFKLGQGAKLPAGKYQWKVLGLNSKTGKWDELSVFDTKKEARTNSIQRSVDASVEWTKLYREKMNDPLMQPEQAIALKKAERTDRRYDEMKAFKEGDFSKWWDSRKKWWGEAIHDQAGRVRSALLKHFGEDGQRLLSYIESVPGGARYGEEKFRQMTKEVYDGLGKNLTEALDRFHMYKRFADIWSYNPEWKAPNGIKRDETLLNVLHFKERNNLSDADFKLIQERSELMFNHARSWVDEFLLDTGIIGPEEAKALKSHDYSKMKYLQTYADVFDRSTTSKVGDVKVSNYDSGVDPLGHGGASIAETDQRIVYNEIARRMAGRAANQRSRQAMREFATQFPDNGMIWHKGIEGKRPKGWVKDYVWDFETPVESVETSYPSRQPIWLHPDFARQVATVGADMSYRFAWATKLLGTDLVRSLAVGTSAVWATVVNLPIDIMHTFFSPRIFKDGKEVGVSEAKAIYSPFFPKYLMELGSNYIDVASDVWNRGPKYDAYAKYGGLLQFLTQRQSHITGHMQRPGKFDQLLDILSAHGRNTELLTRIGIMDRVVDQKAGELGMTKDELWKRENAKPESEILRLATHVARENMPYGQTGWMVKILDRFIPFAGANYVGGKTFWRAAVERPADFSARIANIGATAVGITAMSLLYNPKAYREIDDNDKNRNIVIPFLPDYLKFKDSKGEERTWNMKIPGTGGPMFFYNLFSGLTHKFMYEAGMTNIPPSYDSIIKSLAQNAPVQSMAPPVISALTSYVTNYSIWQDRNLFTKLGGKTFSWPQSKAEGINDPNVAQLAKSVGGATGLSPTRLQGAVGELIPKNNEFMWLFGKTYEGLFSGVPEKIQERVWQETIVKTPGVNRLFSLNTPDAYRQTGDVSRGLQEEKVEMRNYLRKSEFDLLMEEKARGGDVNEKLGKFFTEVGKEDPEAAKRFMKDTMKLSMIEKMENKSIWMGMLGKSDELKAMDFYERMKVETSPKEQESLGRELGTLMAAKFVGKGFMRELSRLRWEDKK